jgi:SprT protein
MNIEARRAALSYDYYSAMQEARQLVKDTYKELGCPELFDETDIVWNNRLRATVGRARYNPKRRHTIELSRQLWPHFRKDDDRLETIMHEACHIVANYMHGRSISAHGYQWKTLMMELGIPATRCHDIDIYGLGLSRKREREVFFCECGPKVIGPVVAKRIRLGRTYRCRQCMCILSETAKGSLVG